MIGYFFIAFSRGQRAMSGTHYWLSPVDRLLMEHCMNERKSTLVVLPNPSPSFHSTVSQNDKYMYWVDTPSIPF